MWLLCALVCTCASNSHWARASNDARNRRERETDRDRQGQTAAIKYLPARGAGLDAENGRFFAFGGAPAPIPLYVYIHYAVYVYVTIIVVKVLGLTGGHKRTCPPLQHMCAQDTQHGRAIVRGFCVKRRRAHGDPTPRSRMHKLDEIDGSLLNEMDYLRAIWSWWDACCVCFCHLPWWQFFRPLRQHRNRAIACCWDALPNYHCRCGRWWLPANVPSFLLDSRTTGEYWIRTIFMMAGNAQRTIIIFSHNTVCYGGTGGRVNVQIWHATGDAEAPEPRRGFGSTWTSRQR